MLKFLLSFCFVLPSLVEIRAGTTFYDCIPTGTYQVAFTDTLLFSSKYNYKAFSYSGNKPLFVQVWHPMRQKKNKPEYLRFGDFYKWKTPLALTRVQEELTKHYRETLLREGIEENKKTGQPNDFSPHSVSDILSAIERIESKSIACSNIPYSDFPLIVYHHGSQSFPFENYVMAEYFASRGYIFVTAAFHLPYENTVFGLKPFSAIIPGEEEENLKQLVAFSRTLSSSPSVFFVGHSWGAQMGLRSFCGDSSLKGMVSLETTIEFKEDPEKIKSMWPEVYQKIAIEKAEYPFPVLLCAATGTKKAFSFFETMRAPSITFAPTRASFEHNAYTSVFYLRNFLGKKFKQTDQSVLKKQLLLYRKHLYFMHDFFEKRRDNKNMDHSTIRFIR